MTGFEYFTVFVIRRAKHSPKAAARHSRQSLSRNYFDSDEFSNRQMRLKSRNYELTTFDKLLQIYRVYLNKTNKTDVFL
jgi:hypothetical protein